MLKKKILVAPLNWGLGHATRCIPIINALISDGFEPVLASDGAALALLKKEFPNLAFYELPSYNITYPKKGALFQFKMLLESPKLLKSIYAEQKALKKILKTAKFHGIISDNRMGIRSTTIPSVFITHQLNVLSGSTTKFSSKLHRRYIKKFDECWVPDLEGSQNLSGKLGHLKNSTLRIKYLGPLSRFNKQLLPKTYDLLAMVSGPEPQREMIEDIFKVELKHFKGDVLLIKGKIEDKQTIEKDGNLTIYNYMMGKELEDAFNQSDLVISRSGYTTLMDVAKLGKPAFFIPTPGQFEQKYLAKRLKKMKLAPACKQHKFKVEKLKQVSNYDGLGHLGNQWVNFSDFFKLF